MTTSIDWQDPRRTNTTLGQRIADARRHRSMSQLYLAKNLGLSRAAIGQWETNSTSPSIEKLREAAMVLDVPPEWLAFNANTPVRYLLEDEPERSDVTLVPVLDLHDRKNLDDSEEMWAVPTDYIISELSASPDRCVIYKLHCRSIEPDYKVGDLVLVDQKDTKPSPPGIFAFSDGIGVDFARINSVPGERLRLRISQKGFAPYEASLSKVKIIGRVKGHFQHC